MTINTKQCPHIELPNKYKGAICISGAACEYMSVHTSVHAYWRGALNHWSSMVVDLEVDVNVKVSPKRSCCLQLASSADIITSEIIK